VHVDQHEVDLTFARAPQALSAVLGFDHAGTTLLELCA
jgi:hypothetical protein